MNYAEWKNISELKNELTRVDKTLNITKSGIPYVYDEENLYIDDKDGHTLVIGATGSGKTQTMVLPQIKLAMQTGESLVIKDNKGEIYEKIANNLEEKGYKIYALNFDDAEYGDSWNPLWLPYTLYKEGNVDAAQKNLETIGHYLFCQMGGKSIDDFWTNAAKQYFVGISLYLFGNGKESEINFNSIYDITCTGEEKKDDKTYFEHILNKLERTSPEYINLSSTICAPTETRGGILSVFRQIVRMFVSRQSLSKMIASNDIDLRRLTKEKTAVFLIGETNSYSVRLEPLFINQLYNATTLERENKLRINVILDEFETLCPLENFSSLLNSSRGLNIKFTIIIKSLLDLDRQYGKENAEILIYSMATMVYLLANDLTTLEEICRLCGNKAPNIPLITPEELKTLQLFEAVVLMPRMMPIRTKLLPDYQIPWDFKEVERKLPEKTKQSYDVFDLKKHV